MPVTPCLGGGGGGRVRGAWEAAGLMAKNLHATPGRDRRYSLRVRTPATDSGRPAPRTSARAAIVLIAALLGGCSGGETPASTAHERVAPATRTPEHEQLVSSDVRAIITGMLMARLRILARLERCERGEGDCQ